MTDVMPDYRVEIQRVRSEIASLTATLERQRLEIMEMESRRARTEENIAATTAAIAEREATLAGLVQEHGDDGRPPPPTRLAGAPAPPEPGRGGPAQREAPAGLRKEGK